MEDFKHLNPKKLEYCFKGYKMRREMEDREAWLNWGAYGTSALIFSIDHCLNGKKAQSKYIEEPIQSKNEEKEPAYKESNEEIAIWEMKQRIKALREQGLPESPD